MSLTFYPHSDDVGHGTLNERVDLLMEAAGRYKGVVLDESAKGVDVTKDVAKCTVPREQTAAFNWGGISRILAEVRALPEISGPDKLEKAELLEKLAGVYEVLRGAKMPKLDAVRLALINEVSQLRGVVAPAVVSSGVGVFATRK